MMSDNDIRRGFQSKLSGFEAPVPPDGWQEVERSLRAASVARRALRRRWYAGTVAAVLLLLVVSILFIQNPAGQLETMVSEMASPPPPPFTGNTPDHVTEGIRPATLESLPRPDVGQAEAVQIAATGSSVKPGTGKEAVVRPSTPAGMLAAWMARMELQGESLKKKMDDAMHRLPVVPPGKEVAEKGEKPVEEETITVRGDKEFLLGRADVAERGEGTLLLAVNKRGGMTGYRQTVNSPMTLRSAVAAPLEGKYPVDAGKMQYQANNITNNVSEMEHDQPVSFGITVSKYLFDRISVETGIVYSYLHSKSRNTNNNFKVEEVQKFHYLGVPLSVNYNLFTLGQLNVYASLGGMVEKDIYGEFRRIKEGEAITNINNASAENVAEVSEEKEITKISQRSPQISVNAGVGLSYPIYDRLRLYGKVGGAYYFDAKNQYKTIYSDRKIVVDLNVGLRYEF